MDVKDLRELAKEVSALKWVDLSHQLQEDIPVFPTHSSFYHMKWEKPNDPAVMFQILMHEHNGTHVDAPAHYLREGVGNRDDVWMDSVPISALFGPAKVLHLPGYDKDRLLTRDAVLRWEDEHVVIDDGDIVICNFGWHHRWTTSERRFEFAQDWPGLDRQAALYLAEKGVRAVGTDCIGLDCDGSTEIPAHDTFLARKILIMENLTNLDQLPDECLFMALPLNIRRGSASPIRAVALTA